MKKGIFHLHSCVSYDGLNTFTTLINFAKKNHLDFIILTDHDTIQGSKILERKISELGLNIEVPIAAEYKTTKGDIIAAYINTEIKNLEFELFLDEVKAQGGIIILPHPYDGHIDILDIASRVDAIEVFNGRSSILNNFKSFLLAKKLKKPMLWASDSHIPSTLQNVIIGYDQDCSFKDALLQDKFVPLNLIRSSYADMYFSQLKKAIYSRSLKLFLSISLGLIIRIFRLNKIK